MSEQVKKGLSVAVDLGTSNMLIYVEGEGTVFNEPSIIAIDKASNKVISVGYKASGLVGKVHNKVTVVSPLQGGVISDVDMIREFLDFTLRSVQSTRREPITKLLICVPSELTETEKDAIMKLGTEIGINDTSIEEEIKAGAIGGGIDIFTPLGHLIVDIGGGTTDVGVISLGDVVVSKSVRVAGNYFDNQIIRHVKEKHGLEIGQQTAERVKIALSNLGGELPKDQDGNDLIVTAGGRDLVSGLPNETEINGEEIRKVLLSCFESIKSALVATLENTPPELSGDLVDNGILVTGGGALIPGVKEYLEDVAKVPVQISPAPLTAVVDGCKKLLKMKQNHYYGEFDS